jgi:hypothetical protein
MTEWAESVAMEWAKSAAGLQYISGLQVTEVETRISLNKFGYSELIPEKLPELSGFGYFRIEFEYFGFGVRVREIVPRAIYSCCCCC